ncbi:MAG: dihydrofolate reductase [Lachnospiraceae bacterium]|nr:dihydrofolate reductase [Lachnospiraceae bacterium]
MNVIVAVDANWGIGKDNQLLASIPNDMKFFRNTTTGHTVIMGRKTLESFPGGKPLKNRNNIVITGDLSYHVDNAIVVHSVTEAVAEADRIGDVSFVIGGESIYRQMLDYCDKAYITKIKHTYMADTYFPNLDQMDEWKVAEESEEMEYEGVKYSFVTYEKEK